MYKNEKELLQEYCINYNTMISPIDILQSRIKELETENKFLYIQYNDLLKENKALTNELSNLKRVD